jgi:hypothetical protein
MSGRNLNDLFDFFQSKTDRDGYVGLDFNMAILCIISKRTGRFVEFIILEDYKNKIEYWASKRHFGEVHFPSEEKMLERAWERFDNRD